MKKVFLLCAVTFATLTISAQSKEQKTSKIEKSVKVNKVSLNVKGMTCSKGFVNLIETELAKKKGVLKAKVDFKNSVAIVEFDKNTNKKELIDLVSKLEKGKYKVSEVVAKKVK